MATHPEVIAPWGTARQSKGGKSAQATLHSGKPGQGLTLEQVRENYTSSLKDLGIAPPSAARSTPRSVDAEAGRGENPATRLESQGLPCMPPHPAHVPRVYEPQMGRHFPGDRPQHTGTVCGMPLVSAPRSRGQRDRPPSREIHTCNEQA